MPASPHRCALPVQAPLSLPAGETSTQLITQATFYESRIDRAAEVEEQQKLLTLVRTGGCCRRSRRGGGWAARIPPPRPAPVGPHGSAAWQFGTDPAISVISQPV